MVNESTPMPGTMPVDERRAHGHLPSSGQLIGVLVEVFDLRCESKYLKNSTARRWFHGGRISARSRNRIITEVASSLGSALGGSTEIRSEASLKVAAAAWDGVRDTVTSLSTSLESSGVPWTVPAIMMRGLVVAQLGALLPKVEVEGIPPARIGGVGELLRRWQRAGSRRVSRDELSAGLQCSRNTVDAWLDRGALPKLESMRALARFFARRVGGSEGGLLTELRCRCARSRFGRWLRLAVHGRSDRSREAVLDQEGPCGVSVNYRAWPPPSSGDPRLERYPGSGPSRTGPSHRRTGRA